jgi:hypothetical protein
MRLEPPRESGTTWSTVSSSREPHARHALYQLDVLALLVLALEAHVHPAVVAGVGCLVGGGRGGDLLGGVA